MWHAPIRLVRRGRIVTSQARRLTAGLPKEGTLAPGNRVSRERRPHMRSGTGSSVRRALVLFLGGLAIGVPLLATPMVARSEPLQFTTEFRFEDCAFKATGANPHFILTPGYRLVLEGAERRALIRLVITVLAETETVLLPGLGQVDARVVEEREWVDGVLVEVSRNLFAICDKTNDVFYFGEAVGIFNPDGTVSHEGSWRAGGARARGFGEARKKHPRTFLFWGGDG